ncbi:MAG TPA: XTP/dITP diphosphatase [Clostridiales bacterium]|nr:XTP/dITP diphosphatase [Clostridiales bacterium]
MDRIVVATHNKGKVREIREILKDIPFEIVSLDEIGYDIYVEEDQPTFEGNAFKKAIETMKHTGEITIADDSGLEVYYLNGQPGVCSARYAGSDATDEENIAKLLNALKGVPKESRHAVFRCSIVMAYPNGRILKSEGICKGRIGFTPRGSGGFGYDPIFVIDDKGTTFAQLEPDKKNKLSHRGKALRQLKSLLEDIYKES